MSQPMKQIIKKIVKKTPLYYLLHNFRLLANPDVGYKRTSFSQSGEDSIVAFLFSALEIAQPSYMDIGAHHPTHLSNSAAFYQRGCRGVNVEPDPILFKAFERHRKRDINLNIGIGVQQGVLDLYLMSSPTMNTFSREQAEELVREHEMSIRQVLPVPVDTLPNVIEQYCGGDFPDFLSLDVEGLDLEVLATIDYQHTSPKVICVETISYSTKGRGKKDMSIISFLQGQDYILYADTYINSVFVRRSLWER